MLSDEVSSFWKTFRQTLMLLARIFPDAHTEISYQLEEDVDIMSFKPLISPATAKIWKDGEYTRPKFDDQAVQRLPHDQEMLARIGGLLSDARQLAADEVGATHACE